MVDKILSFHVDYEELRQNLLTALQLDFNIKKATEALQNWPALDWPGLLIELKKQKIGVSLPKQMEWKPFFDEQRAKALALQTERSTTDRQIDQLVYALYGLTDADVALVEGRQS